MRERLHLVSAFAGTMPGQHAQVRRWRVLSSLAHACVAPLFSIRQGDPVSRHLTSQTGRHCLALAVMPFYFDPFVGDLAHALFLGPNGSGKTVVVSFLPCLSGFHTHPLDVVARDFAAWRRRLGKAKRAQHRGGSLGTLRFAQPTSLRVPASRSL
ncbi:MAG: hypothetical protein Q8O79_09785 [Pseudomonadota bacterium]|nr:hypothetical protein [Pseudomonadota bacterium]